MDGAVNFGGWEAGQQFRKQGRVKGQANAQIGFFRAYV
jgi:hypothetical protein